MGKSILIYPLLVFLLAGGVAAEQNSQQFSLTGCSKTITIPDFQAHFLGGMSSALLLSSLAFPLLGSEDPLAAASITAALGLTSSLLAGSLKELVDLCGWGTPEWRDLFTTALGGVIASSLVFTLTYLAAGDTVHPAGASLAMGSYGVLFLLPVAEVWIHRGKVRSARVRGSRDPSSESPRRETSWRGPP